MTAPSFTDWLATRLRPSGPSGAPSHDGTPSGVLAWNVHYDPNWPAGAATLAEFQEYFAYYGAAQWARDGLAAAWAEYEQATA